MVSGLVFSLGTGVIHTYYTVALAPAIAALVAIGARGLWRERRTLRARAWLAGGIAVTAGWSWVLLDRTPTWQPWLRPVIGVSAALAIICLLAPAARNRLGTGAPRLAAMLAAVACLAGPLAYSVQTISTPHTGSIPSAGPSSTLTASGGPGDGGIPAGGARGPFSGTRHGGGAFAPPGSARGFAGGAIRAGAGGGFRPGAGGGSRGGAGGAQTVNSSLVKALEGDSGRYRWVAAVSGSQTAASLELATGGDPVMAIGGFDGQGGNLSLAQFKQYVASGEIHYYIAGQGGGGSRAVKGTPAARSQAGCKPISRPRRSAARPSTTCRGQRDESGQHVDTALLVGPGAG